MKTKYVSALGRFGRSVDASARAAIIVATAFMFLLPSVAAAQANGQLQIHFIPVGQGDAALIISPLGETMLIDSGPQTASSCASATGVVTYLASIGLTRLDYHVASHYDADHIGCTDHVVTRWPIQRLAYDRGTANVPTTPTQTYTRYANSVSGRRATVTVGQQIVLDAASSNPVVFHVAGVNGNGVSVSDENDRSVVLVLRFGRFDAEFGGDLPGFNVSGHRDLESLIAPSIGQVELHKVHHHGSASSSNPGFMATIRPKVAVLSVGSNNSYGHPTFQALDSIRSVGALTYWTTDGNGAPPQPGWDVLANGPVRVAVSPGATAFAVSAGGTTAQFAMWEQSVAPPPAPTGLLAAPGSPARVNLTWNASPGATSYNVQRRTGGGALQPLASGVTTTSYADTTVAQGTIYTYVVSAVNTGGESPNSNEVSITITVRASDGDLDGDGKTDIALYRPSTGVWYILKSSTNFTGYGAYEWGVSTDVPVPSDYDGDGKTDIAVYRPSTGVWYILKSSTNFTGHGAYEWGVSTDVPVPSDYDGDGKTDIAVYRPSTGVWYILKSSTNFTSYGAYEWGVSTDVPVPSDYDGDGKTDIAVYRPSTGVWYILKSSTNFTSYGAYEWGVSTDVPVPSDYDGDGKTDIAVYRPSTGVWYILKSSTNFTGYGAYEWGVSTDVPVPSDYDGDGKTDIAVYRPSTGVWYILKSSTNFTGYGAYEWGVSTDVPVIKRS